MGSIRVRTTLAAVLVVAVALAVGAAILVHRQRTALREGVESNAEERASGLAAQIQAQGLPDRLGSADDPDEDNEASAQVVDAGGEVVLGPTTLPQDGYVTQTSVTEVGGRRYEVRVAASLDDVEESTDALVPLLATGLPLLLVVVGATTWFVVSRALRPVDRIRREVVEISDDRLGRRVPVPAAHDEVHRLAVTMNAMLARLEAARDRQRRFVADASHELRSPLAALRQTAEIARSYPVALPAGELAETALEESLRLERLVDQLLLLARTEATGPTSITEVDVDDVVLNEAARVRRPGLMFDTSGVRATRVRTDQVMIRQVVANLVDNAVRHARSEVRVLLVGSDSGVELTVDDDGAGIRPEDRDRVFERFVRLDAARARDDGGTGLGLAIVREVLRSVGGHVTVDDSPLGGARFSVRLATAGAGTRSGRGQNVPDQAARAGARPAD